MTLISKNLDPLIDKALLANNLFFRTSHVSHVKKSTVLNKTLFSPSPNHFFERRSSVFSTEKLNFKVFTHEARRWRGNQTQYFRAACGLRNRTKNKINLYITIPYSQSKIKKYIKTPPYSYYVSYILKLTTCQ